MLFAILVVRIRLASCTDCLDLVSGLLDIPLCTQTFEFINRFVKIPCTQRIKKRITVEQFPVLRCYPCIVCAHICFQFFAALDAVQKIQ